MYESKSSEPMPQAHGAAPILMSVFTVPRRVADPHTADTSTGAQPADNVANEKQDLDAGSGMLVIDGPLWLHWPEMLLWASLEVWRISDSLSYVLWAV